MSKTGEGRREREAASKLVVGALDARAQPSFVANTFLTVLPCTVI